MKYADVRSAFKKGNIPDKKYKPISNLLNLSKAYGRLIHGQLYPFFNQIFSKSQYVNQNVRRKNRNSYKLV